jgi:hypothetical protein
MTSFGVLAELSKANTPHHVEAAHAAFHDNGDPHDVDAQYLNVDTGNRHTAVDGRLRGHDVNDGN